MATNRGNQAPAQRTTALPGNLDDAPFGDQPVKPRAPVGLNSHDNKFGIAPKDQRTCNGIVFDSASEMRVWKALTEQIPAEHLHRQVPFELLPAFEAPLGEKVRAMKFVADMVLGPLPINNKSIVIDVKGMLLSDFMIKRKMFLWRYNLPLYLASGSMKTGTRKKKRAPKGGCKLAVDALVKIYQTNWPNG